MNRKHPAGFTLVEVLVAVALAGIILAVALSMLFTSRQVAEEMQRPIFLPETTFQKQLRADLDQLIVTPVFQSTPPIKLSEDTGLSIVTMGVDRQDVPHPYQVTYLMQGSSLLRILEGGHPSITTTNQVLEGVTRFRWRVFEEGEAYETWPREEGPDLPQRVEVTFTGQNQSEREATFDLPATYSVEAPSVSDEKN